MGFFGLNNVDVLVVISTTFETNYLLFDVLFPLKFRKNYGNNYT